MKVEQLRRKAKESLPKVATAHDDTGHWYVSPATGQKYESVTGVLSILKDPSIQNFKKNRALDYLMENLAPFDREDAYLVPKPAMIELVEQAWAAPEVAFQDAGDIGSEVHAFRQRFFQAEIESEAGLSYNLAALYVMDTPLSEQRREVVSCLRALDRFRQDFSYRPVACEVPLVDDSLQFGGTADDIGLVRTPRGEALAFIDLKTSNQFKNSYHHQVALYWSMWVKSTGIRPKEAMILKLSKEDGTYKTEYLSDIPQLVRDARQLVQLKRAVDRLTEARKKKPIVI